MKLIGVTIPLPLHPSYLYRSAHDRSFCCVSRLVYIFFWFSVRTTYFVPCVQSINTVAQLDSLWSLLSIAGGKAKKSYSAIEK